MYLCVRDFSLIPVDNQHEVIDPCEHLRPQRPDLVLGVGEDLADLEEVQDELCRVTDEEEGYDDEEEHGHGVVPPLVVGDGVVPLGVLPDGPVGQEVAQAQDDQRDDDHEDEVGDDDGLGVVGVVAEGGDVDTGLADVDEVGGLKRGKKLGARIQTGGEFESLFFQGGKSLPFCATPSKTFLTSPQLARSSELE